MKKILIMAETQNDLVSTILRSCPESKWFSVYDREIPFDQYDSICVLGGDRETGLTLPAKTRNLIEKMREEGKAVFCEFMNSIGPIYSGGATKTTHHRLIYSDEYLKVDGLEKGYILDGHFNEVLPYYFVPKNAKPILTYHDYICGHDYFDMDSETFRKGKWGLWQMDDKTLISSFRLSNFNRARFAPANNWEKVITYIISFLAGETVSPVFSEPVCLHNRGGEITCAADVDAIVERGLKWIHNANILVDNGSNGALEGFSHHILARDGKQLIASSVRADCTAEIGGAFLMDYFRKGKAESFEIFKNTAGFCFDEMQVKSGEHYGMVRWTDTAWETCYQDDVARVLLPTLLCENFVEKTRFFKNAVEALEYLAKTTGEDGLRVMRTDCSSFNDEYRAKLKRSGVGTPCAHYNAYYHATLLLATRAGADKSFAELAEKGLSSIMALYPNNKRETSETEEMCRLILPLALLYEYTGKEEHYQWLHRVTEDLSRVQHASGGYAEWDTDYKAACARNHKGECALLANNGDPVADLLYSNNWLPLAFSYAYMVTKETYFYDKWKEIATFLSNCQIHSKDPLLDGAWTRAMDMERMEAYGVPHDVGWAPCCMESGWTVGEILMGLQFMTVAEKEINKKGR